MKVHHISNSFDLEWGGAERLVRVIHNGVLNKGISSKLIGLAGRSYPDLQHSTSFESRTPYSLKSIIRLTHYTIKNITEKDIVHGHLFPTIFYLALLKKIGLLKAKLICTEHNTHNRRRGTYLGQVIDRILFSEVKYVIAISEGTKQNLLNWQRRLEGKVFVINNGAKLPFKEKTNRCYKKIPTIISVGRLHNQKNYETAIRSMVFLNDLDFNYIIAGTGEKMGALKQLVNHLGLAGKVTFLGHISDIASQLKKADIFLLPSLWEGFGLAVVEAMNASLPVIISDVPGMKELLSDDGLEGFLIPPTAPKQIAKKLRVLISSASLRAEKGANAFKRSLEFGEEKMIDKYLSFYNSAFDFE